MDTTGNQASTSRYDKPGGGCKKPRMLRQPSHICSQSTHPRGLPRSFTARHNTRQPKGLAIAVYMLCAHSMSSPLQDALYVEQFTELCHDTVRHVLGARKAVLYAR